jgi:hypothetical protein
MIANADVLEISRIRERIRLAEAQIKSGQWELEKLLRRIYGDDLPQHGAGTVHIHIGISRDDPRPGETIEGEPQ